MAVFQHKHSKVCPTSVIIQLANAALRDCRGQPVACVLMNEADVFIFHHEVTSTDSIPADRLTVLEDAKAFWADTQSRLWLMTYAQLSDILAVPGARPQDDLKLLLHMGCGEYTWEIVKTCHDLWKWAWSFEDPIVWVYTISNLEESIYRDAPSTYFTVSGTAGPQVEWHEPEAFADTVSKLQQEDAAHAELLRRTQLSEQQQPDQPALHTNRAVVFTSTGQLLEAYERQGCRRPAGYIELKGNMAGSQLGEWLTYALQDDADVKSIVVHTDVGAVGAVRNLGSVLVFPVRSGLFFDRRISQMVYRHDIPMSQAEVRYACRAAFGHSGSGSGPVVSIFATKAGFEGSRRARRARRHSRATSPLSSCSSANTRTLTATRPRRSGSPATRGWSTSI